MTSALNRAGQRRAVVAMLLAWCGIVLPGCSAYREMRVGREASGPVIREAETGRAREASAFAGKDVRVVMIDGTRYYGHILHASDAVIEMETRQLSSEISAAPRGMATFAVADVATIAVCERKTEATIVVLVTTGMIMGALAAAAHSLASGMGN